MNLPRYKIAEGISASCLASDKFKVNSITLGIELPLNIENVTSANLLTRVLKRGCKKYPDIGSIEKQLDELYAAGLALGVNRSGESHYLCVYTDFLSSLYTEGCDIIKEIVDMIGEVLLNPLTADGAFNQAYVKSEKKNLSDDIDSLINNKAKYARNRCIEEMCKDEVYSLSMFGDKSILEAITPKELCDFHFNMLKKGRIEILYTGDEKFFDKVCAELSRVFSQLPREYNALPCTCEVRSSAEKIREITEEMEINQGKLSIGMRTGVTNSDSDIGALIVANEIFGGSPNSKLFMNVREKMSLCYYCSSGLDAVKGLMFVNAGIESENYEIAKNAILKQLDAVKAGEFTDEEFESAVNSLVNSYKSVSDSVSALENWYMPRIFRGEQDTPETRLKQVTSVTKEDAARAAKRISPDVIFFLRGSKKEA
ncbi:MAG: insulinase family protein [Clostridia bacterium]|nr:insulinase family protein [Clostridia bacterium]